VHAHAHTMMHSEHDSLRSPGAAAASSAIRRAHAAATAVLAASDAGPLLSSADAASEPAGATICRQAPLQRPRKRLFSFLAAAARAALAARHVLDPDRRARGTLVPPHTYHKHTTHTHTHFTRVR
jgi:hypothetical protein